MRTGRVLTFREILAHLELLSHGATMKIDANRIHRSKAGTSQPAGESNPPHLEFLRRYEAAFSEKSRREIVQEAERYLYEWQHTKPPEGPEWGSYHWRVMIANDPRPDKILVAKYHVSRQTLSTWRRKYRKDAA